MRCRWDTGDVVCNAFSHRKLIMSYNLGFGQYQPGVNGSAQNPYLQQNVNTALSDISKQYQTTTAPAMASRM